MLYAFDDLHFLHYCIRNFILCNFYQFLFYTHRDIIFRYMHSFVLIWAILYTCPYVCSLIFLQFYSSCILHIESLCVCMHVCIYLHILFNMLYFVTTNRIGLQILSRLSTICRIYTRNIHVDNSKNNFTT